MKISWIKLLSALNCPSTNPNAEALQPCPFHPHTEPSLRVCNSDHALYFTCCRANCNFKGDAVTLVAKHLNVSFLDALDMFKPGNRFHATLLADTSSTQLIEYSNPHINQDIIERYVAECHHYLTSQDNEHVSQINNFLVTQKWTHSSLRHIPPDMGYLNSGTLPAILESIDSKAYKFEPHIIFGLRYDGKIVGFRILNIASGITTTHRLVTEKNYLFIPQAIGGSDRLFVAQNELTAFAIYSKSKTYSTIPIPVVSMTDALLPGTFQNVKTIYLINSKKHPLTLTTGLEIFKNHQVIDGSLSVPNIHVLSVPQDITECPLDRFMTVTSKHKLGLNTWIAAEMVQLHASGVVSRLFDSLSVTRLPADKLEVLITSLKRADAPQEFIDDIADYNLKASDELYLSNGNTIRKTRSGLIGRSPVREKVVLSNVVFDIHKKHVTNDNKNVIVDCTLRVGDNSIRTTLEHDAFSRLPLLKEAVNKAFMTAGISPKMAIYGVRGFPWDEIRDLLTESAVVGKEIPHLGLTDIKTVDFPKCRVASDVTLQSNIFTLPRPVLDMYKGLYHSPSDPGVKPFEALWKNHDDTSLGLAAVVSHVIHCVASGMVLLAGGNVQPAHMLFVRSPANALDVLFSQIVTLFSGTEILDRLPYVNPLRALKGMKELGSLPFISLLPRFNIDRQIALLAESPVSVISAIPEEDCSMFADIRNMTYLVNDSQTIYNAQSIVDLQQSFPYFLQRLIHSGIALTGQYPTPAVAVYESIAQYFGVVAGHLENVVKPYYVAISTSLDKQFFNEVRLLLQENNIQVHHSAPPEVDADRTMIYVTDTEAYIPRKIIDILNRGKQRKRYKAEAIEYHLTEAGIIVSKNPHFWIVPKNVWDRYIGKVLNTVMFGRTPFTLMALSS